MHKIILLRGLAFFGKQTGPLRRCLDRHDRGERAAAVIAGAFSPQYRSGSFFLITANAADTA
jgi:hypothetical protein